MSPRSQTPGSLGSILEGVIDRLGIRRRLLEAAAVDAWYTVGGPAITAVTDAVWMSSGRLFVKISSPTWRHELNLQREDWKDQVNRQVGSPVVKEIVFR